MSRLIARSLSVRAGGKTVLDSIGAVFEPGQVTAVIGPNGAGKSTLLMALAGLRRPSAGAVTLDGVDLARRPPRDRAKRIGYLPQLAEVAWAIDVRTLVGLGRTPHHAGFGADAADDAAVAAALAATNTASLADRDVTTLSGGERGRVLIARALAGEPDWLLADEPLTALDPGVQIDIADLLKRLAREGRGVVVTLHDLGFAARLADRILVLTDGRILADGSVAAVLSQDVIARAYGVETHVTTHGDRISIDITGRNL
ncbi:MAG: ABC transporter ATP-binding protein [Alphaproteobacteria bacterium]|nr:ABC transporter ATP-binding protein [Alphaproteobacteria bacterium]